MYTFIILMYMYAPRHAVGCATDIGARRLNLSQLHQFGLHIIRFYFNGFLWLGEVPPHNHHVENTHMQGQGCQGRNQVLNKELHQR